MSFHVGQKVVCVDTESPIIRGHPGQLRRLTKGAEYTIAAMRRDPATDIPALQLDECPHDHWWFQAKRFRPVIERKTDISIFTEMLKPRELARVID